MLKINISESLEKEHTFIKIKKRNLKSEMSSNWVPWNFDSKQARQQEL